MLGVIFGLVSALMFKSFRLLTINPLVETVVIFCIAYIAYGISEAIEDSGIITMLTCGILMG